MLSARRWPTELTPEQFEHVTGLDTYPDYLASDVGPDSVLRVYANGERLPGQGGPRAGDGGVAL